MSNMKRRILIASLMASVAGGAVIAKLDAEANVSRALAAAHITAAGMSANILTGAVELRGLDRQTGPDRLHIGKLTLHRAPLSLVSTAFAASAEPITLEDISATFGIFTVDIPEVVITGSKLSEAELTELFDEDSKTPLSERLKKLDAETLESEEITVTADYGGENGSETTYSNIKADRIKAGTIAKLTIGSIEQSIDMSVGKSVAVNTGETEATGVNLPAYLHFLMDAASTEEPLQVAVESSIVKDISYSFEQQNGENYEIKMAAASTGVFKTRAMKSPMFEWIKTVKPQKPGEKPDPAQVAAMMPMVADLYRAIEGSIELKSISFIPTKAELSPQGKIDRITVTDFGKGGIGVISAEGLNLSSPGNTGHGKLASISLSGLVVSPAFDAFGDAAKNGFKDFNPRQAIPTLSKFSLAGLELEAPAKDGMGNSADGKITKFGLGKLELNLSNYLGGIPSIVSAGLDHFTFDAPTQSTPGEMQPFKDWGLSKLDSSAKIDLAYSEANQNIDIKEISLGDPSLGRLAAKGLISGVSKDVFDIVTTKAMLAASGAAAKSLDVKFENSGGFEKFMAMKAKETGQAPEDLKKSYAAMATLGIPAMLGGDSPAAKAVADRVSKFINDPKNLHIELTAKDSLGVADIGSIASPADLLKKVELKATANE